MPQYYISPWKGSEEQRRRAMSVPSAHYKPPAPPQTPPEPKKWFVLGMEVDYDTYRDFMYERSYKIDGDVLRDIPCNLWALEHYATDEHAKERPIEAANARKILDQIREEIAATQIRKDDDNMKECKTAADFIDALNEIFVKTRQTYDAATDKLEKARRKMEQASEDTRKPGEDHAMAEARYFIAKGEFQLAEGENRRGYYAMIDAHNKQVGELREKFAAFLGEHYRANPDKLDAATMQLLGTGICTPADLERLVDRHQSNPTMLRVLGEHAKKLYFDNQRTMSDANKAACMRIRNIGNSAKDGSRELKIFDEAAATLNHGLAKDAAIAAKMATHIPEWMDGYKARMNNLPVIPEEMAPAAQGGDE